MLIQNPGDTLLRWFYTNAPAAWISALIATISLLFVLRLRNRPRRLVVREVSNASLVRIWPGVRRKIKITFLENAISSLGQVEFEVFNEGSEVIQRPELTLTLPERSTVLDIELTPEDLGAEAEISRHRVKITLPHLNAFHEHHQILGVSLLVDGPTGSIKAAGSGEGWSVRHCALPTARQRMLWERAEAATLGITAASAVSYVVYVPSKFGIRPSEWSLRAFLVTLPALVAMFGTTFGLLWMRRRRSGRRVRAR